MSPSETEQNEIPAVGETRDLANRVADVVGGTVAEAKDTPKIKVDPSDWRRVIRTARDELGFIYLSFLSAVDWSADVAVGDAPEDFGEERLEVLCAVGDLSEGNLVVFSTDLDKERPELDSLVPVYLGAEWHEREAFEMFGIDFKDHPNLIHLYLPDSFDGNPLRKSFPLLSREVKPWPGTVDVEGMPDDDEGPSTENPGA